MSRKWQWRLALILIGFAGVLENAEAQALEGPTGLTVLVTDYAQVDTPTLGEAERVAVAIFRNAGVETSWLDISPISHRPSANLIGPDLNTSSSVQLHILSREMASRLGMADNVMGLAPGKEPGRQLVYVFYPYVKKLAERQAIDQMKGYADVRKRATAAQILGVMMAHEVGHILLNLPLHSTIGIMKGDWDLKDLSDIAYGYLFFTRQQAAVVRADVARRSAQKPREEQVSGQVFQRDNGPE